MALPHPAPSDVALVAFIVLGLIGTWWLIGHLEPVPRPIAVDPAPVSAPR